MRPEASHLAWRVPQIYKSTCILPLRGSDFFPFSVFFFGSPDLEVDLDAPETELLPLDRDAEA